MSDREAPAADERYECATNASNLWLPPPDLPDGAADVIMAGAWSGKLGSMLLRLAAQWAAEKPQRIEPPTIKALEAAGLAREDAQAEHAAQQLLSAKLYARQLGWLVGRLRELGEVREALTSQAISWGIGNAQDPAEDLAARSQRALDVEHLLQILRVLRWDGSRDAVGLLGAVLRGVRARRQAQLQAQYARAAPIASAVVHFWLDQTCRVCHGRKFRQIPGTPVLSEHACSECKGTGKAKAPYGEAGRRLATYLDDCQFRAEQGIRNKLRGRRGAASARRREFPRLESAPGDPQAAGPVGSQESLQNHPAPPHARHAGSTREGKCVLPVLRITPAGADPDA